MTTESGSRLWPTRIAKRADTEGALAKLKAAAAEKQQTEVAEDLQIMISRVQLNFRMQDYPARA